MALWHFTNFNKYGNPRHRIFYRPDGEPFSHGPGFGSTMVRRFKYDYEHPVLPPTILELNGKTYLMPLWQEVENGTTVNDINWTKPKPKVKQEPIIETHTSSSNANKTYKTAYYPESGKFYCDCPGRWRAFDNRCKHIKSLEIKLKIN
jgi:hypothetical protein